MAITWLLDTPALQRKLITNGRHRAQEFTLENMVRHTETLYTEMMKDRSY